MQILFILNPTAGKTDCTRELPRQIEEAAARAGLSAQEYTIQVTTHAGHARELAHAAAERFTSIQQAATAPSTKRLPALTDTKTPLWAACPSEVEMTFCVPSAQKKSFWIWMPSLPEEKCPST